MKQHILKKHSENSYDPSLYRDYTSGNGLNDATVSYEEEGESAEKANKNHTNIGEKTN